jgi:hypothetical protein
MNKLLLLLLTIVSLITSVYCDGCTILSHRSQKVDCTIRLDDNTSYSSRRDPICNYDHYLTILFRTPNKQDSSITEYTREIKFRQYVPYKDWTDSNLEVGTTKLKYCDIYYNEKTMSALLL